MNHDSQDITPDRPINVTMVLADHAQIADGKLFIAGGGWTDITRPVPFALALIFEVPPERAGQHAFEIDLIDPDGQKVVHHEGGFAVEAPADAPEGITFVNPFVIKHGPIEFPPANYEWRLMVDGEARANWRLPFRVHAPQQG